jgi:hypothetical protein
MREASSVPDAGVERDARRYLAQLDQLLPGEVLGFYLVGSVALGAYRRRRSDLDFVAVLQDECHQHRLARLRLAHVRSGAVTGARALREHRSPLTGTFNGVFIRESDLGKPVTTIVPVASQTGTEFHAGRAGSDLSPVGWKVLGESGVPLRGPQPAQLTLDPQPELLRPWTAGNLEAYWRPWAESVARAPYRRFRLRPRWATAWGVLGAPRLHCTMATGDVISKEAAGDYARAEFPPKWRALIEEALAYWREEPERVSWSPRERALLTAEFVTFVIEQAAGLTC